MSASVNAIDWKCATGLPNALRSCVYSSANSYAARASPTCRAALMTMARASASSTPLAQLAAAEEPIAVGDLAALENHLVRRDRLEPEQRVLVADAQPRVARARRRRRRCPPSRWRLRAARTPRCSSAAAAPTTNALLARSATSRRRRAWRRWRSRRAAPCARSSRRRSACRRSARAARHRRARRARDCRRRAPTARPPRRDRRTPAPRAPAPPSTARRRRARARSRRTCGAGPSGTPDFSNARIFGRSSSAANLRTVSWMICWSSSRPNEIMAGSRLNDYPVSYSPRRQPVKLTGLSIQVRLWCWSRLRVTSSSPSTSSASM